MLGGNLGSLLYGDVSVMGWGRLIFMVNFLKFMLNLPKVYIDNACYISVSSVGVFFSNSFRFNEVGCFK